MSNFWHEDLKIHELSADDQKYIKDQKWHITNGRDLPPCAPEFWELVDGEIVKMAQEKIDLIIENRKQFKSADLILSQIMSNPKFGPNKSRVLIRKYGDFATCLQKRRHDMACDVVDDATADGVITAEEAIILKSIILEKT